MAISLIDNLKIQNKKQNVERDSFATIADMVSYSPNYLPNIFHAMCEETGKMYVYNVNNDEDETLGKWRVLEGSGGGTAEVPIEKIKVNGELQTPVNKVVDITVPDAYDDTEVKSQIQAVANGLMDSVGYSADYKTIDIIAKNGVKKSVDVAPIISHASVTELADVDTTNKATGKALVYNEATSKHEYATISDTDEKVKMDTSGDSKYLGELLDNVTITNENGELKVKKLDGQEVSITEINYLKGLTMNVMDLVNMFSNGGVKIINTPVATYAELLTIDKSAFIDGISYLVYVLADENHDNAKTTYLVDKNSATPTYFGFADSQRDFVTNPIDLATEITGKLGISNMDSDAIKALFTVDDTYKTETATNNAFSTHGAKALYDELLLAIGNKANDSDLTAHRDDTSIHVSTTEKETWNKAQENVIETVNVNGSALTPTDKAVDITVPTTVAELTDSADYAKTFDLHSHTNKTVLDGITSTKVSNWDSAKTHADSAHAPSNAQANVIETVKVNGSALSVSDKAVDVKVPTKVSELTNDSGYATETYVSNKLGSTDISAIGDGSVTGAISAVNEVIHSYFYPTGVITDIEVGENGAIYTSPSDGFVQVTVGGVTDAVGYASIITSNPANSVSLSEPSGNNQRVKTFVKKGEEYRVYYSVGENGLITLKHYALV